MVDSIDSMSGRVRTSYNYVVVAKSHGAIHEISLVELKLYFPSRIANNGNNSKLSPICLTDPKLFVISFV